MNLNQKIRNKAEHVDSIKKFGWKRDHPNGQVLWLDDVNTLLDEATKQVRLAFSEGVNEHGYHWHYDGPDYARARCEQIIELYEQRTLPEILQKALAVLEGEEKEANP